MPTTPLAAGDKLVARSIADSESALLKRIQQIGFKNASREELLQAFGRNTKDPLGIDPASQKKEHVRLNCRQLYVKDKGEMRLFNASLIHPASKTIAFEAFDSMMLVWLSGLKKGADYSIQIRLRGFSDGIPDPLPNEPGVFKISAGGNDFTLKPTFKEQVVPVSLLSVKDTWSGIWVSAEKMRGWQLYELIASETDL